MDKPSEHTLRWPLVLETVNMTRSKGLRISVLVALGTVAALCANGALYDASAAPPARPAAARPAPPAGKPGAKPATAQTTTAPKLVLLIVAFSAAVFISGIGLKVMARIIQRVRHLTPGQS